MGSEQNLRRLVSERLIAAGYVRTGRNHMKPLVPGVAAIVSTGPLDGRPDIDPWVGLRNDRVEELDTQLSGMRNDAHIATVGSNVGYILGGEFRHWTGDENVEEVLSEIEKAQGVLASFADLARLSDAWKIRGTEGPGYQRRLAVVNYLLGNQPETERWLREAERVECRVQDELCDEFQRFKANLVALLRKHP